MEGIEKRKGKGSRIMSIELEICNGVSESGKKCESKQYMNFFRVN